MTKTQMLDIIKAIKANDSAYITKLLKENTGWLLTHLEGNGCSYGLLPIHYASAEGQLDIVKILLENDSNLLNITDIYNQTPAFWAVTNNHELLVDYLTNKGADLSMQTSKMAYHLIHLAAIKGHLNVIETLLKNDSLLNIADSKGQTPVRLAADYGHIHVVGYLISKNAYIATDFSFIQNGEQALELMIFNPELINILLQNNRIVGLINNINPTQCHTTPQFIDWYKPSGRRPSWFARINTDRGNVSLFMPVDAEGGHTRIFQNTEGQKVVVTSLKNHAVNIPEDKKVRLKNELNNELNREAGFIKRAYPGDNFLEIFELNYKINDQKIYTNLYIRPYVQGETAASLIPKIICPRQLAEITLQIAQELQRIHNVGIICHRLNLDKIIIHCREDKTFTARLIHFRDSSYITEDTATLWNYDSLNPSTPKWIPPELCSQKQNQ